MGLMDDLFNFGGNTQPQPHRETKDESFFGGLFNFGGSETRYDANDYDKTFDPLGTVHNDRIAPGSTRFYDKYGNPQDSEQAAKISNLRSEKRVCLNCSGKGCSYCRGTGTNDYLYR